MHTENLGLSQPFYSQYTSVAPFPLYCVSFRRLLVMFPFYKTRFKAEKNEHAEAHCVLAHTPYPSHSKQQEEGATADNKHVLIFGWYQPVTVTAKKQGSDG